MLPSLVDSGAHIVCQDDELGRPGAVMGAETYDVDFSHNAPQNRLANLIAGGSYGGMANFDFATDDTNRVRVCFRNHDCGSENAIRNSRRG
jgi:hypothetical protein